MLDELISLGAVELLSNQRVKAKARIPIHKGFNNESIRSIGERTSELLGTLIQNLVAEIPLFEANTGLVNTDIDTVALIRREIASRGSSFFSNIEHLLKNANARQSNRSGTEASDYQVGVGVFYFEKNSSSISNNGAVSVRRKNLRRKANESKKQSKSR